MIKGPKAILSSAISNALGEYFVVDANTIESNLLKDAKIVLKKVKLKEQVEHIPINSAGKSTKITVTGCVEEVAFTWAWSMGDTMWLNDAVLTIVGAKFEVNLEHVERINSGTAPVGNDIKDHREAFVHPSTIDEVSARKIKQEKGGLSGFVERQVKMVIDMLTLKLVDFELRIVLPQPPQLPSDDVGTSSSSACNKVLAVGGEKIEVLSFGRDGKDPGVVDSVTKLKQRINLRSFACSIHLEELGGSKSIASYPLLDPFTYSVDVSRLGERFGGFMTGVEVMGLGQPADLCPDVASLTGSGLAAHIGQVQIDSLMQLGVMILAPPVDNETELAETPNEVSSHSEKTSSSTSSDNDVNTFGRSDPSSFVFPLSSASLVLFENMHFAVSCITMRYIADGTVCSVEAAKMGYESNDGGRVDASSVLISMRPAVKMTIGCIESMFIPDTISLSTPVKSSEISYEGNTLTMRLDALDVVTYSKESDQTGPLVSAPYLPCNIDLHIKEHFQMKKSNDGALTKFGRFHLYALKEKDCAKIALQFETFRNHLASMTTVSLCGSVPLEQVNTVNDFIFTAGEVKIMSGHSTDEWTEAFEPMKQKAAKTKQSTATQSKSGTTVVSFPFATMADMNIVIGYEASHKMGRVKDTSLCIKSFKGKADTTSKDIINYYTKACVARVPDFITNVEVLGLNVVDSTTGLWATWAGAGLGLGSAFGAGTGVAAITAVDAVKGAIDAGKRSRNVSEQDGWKPGDFVKGLVQAAGEATRDGARLRGKNGEGNIIDWTVGATTNTTEYVVENKNRLGAAGAGGGGFLLGMALGGPIGAVVGGLVASASTGATLESLDKWGQTKKIEGSKESKDVTKK